MHTSILRKLVAALVFVLIALAVAVATPTKAPAASTACTPIMASGQTCKQFTNPTRTVRWVRQTLLASGFSSRGLRVKISAPQRITYEGYQQGDLMWGDVFKTGDHRLWISFTWADTARMVPVSEHHTFKTSFVP